MPRGIALKQKLRHCEAFFAEANPISIVKTGDKQFFAEVVGIASSLRRQKDACSVPRNDALLILSQLCASHERLL